MFKVVDLDTASGNWVEQGAFATLAEGQSRTTSADTYVFWDGPIPTAETDQQKLFDEIQAANGGRIERVTVGLDMSNTTKNSALSMCPGRCFCVIVNGGRRCETYWCSGSEWCWWVPCGMSC